MNRAWKPIAMQLEGKVLHSLRRRLMTEDPERVALDPEVPTIMMMLCLYEIINKCDERWVIHLRGARDLIRTRRRLLTSSSTSNPLLQFSERFFAYQDVIGRTACGEVPIFGEDYWDASDTNADAWLGCSPELVSVVCSITELSRSRRSTDPEEFAIKAESLEQRLASIEQLVSDPDDNALRRSAEAKRLAAIVYLYCALYGATPSTPLVAHHVKEVLSFVSESVGAGLAAGLTWPLFVAAVELNPLDDELWTDTKTAEPVYGGFPPCRNIPYVNTLHRRKSVLRATFPRRSMLGWTSLIQLPAERSAEDPACGSFALVTGIIRQACWLVSVGPALTLSGHV
ncbi:hypothetical protein MPH_01580 [Macrophomina phaseolina MS6]|uniref:Uncharacterized protein n=1 Tax=Macrophomina phaseolina (strain MS6) TaxID=1126212 RepID=K2SX40_MACPH|nr:hypothetical protein MPH_01580 [Macrophomina phaseolina MS6]